MKLLLGFIVLSVVAMALSLMIYLGAFKSVSITTTEAGPYKLVFKHHLGAYHKIVPDIQVAEKWAVANGEKCAVSFGEYIDDPSIVDEDRLNSNGGCLVVSDWSGGKLPPPLQYREIPKRLFVIAEFDGAPSIGPQKVYPKVNKYMLSEGLRSDGPVIEMYELLPMGRMKTRYHFPAKKN